MSYKERSSYDDLGGAFNPKRQDNMRIDKKSKRIIIAVILIGLLLCLAVVAIWFLNFSKPLKEEVPKTEITVKEVPTVLKEEVVLTKEPEVVITDLPALEIETPQRSVTQSQASASSGVWYQEHSVKEGESLESIADRYKLSKETILSVNAIKNISSIKVGTVLRIPDRDGQLYTVQSGDSLSIITNRFNPALGWKNLQEINNLSSVVIFPGQKLFIPSVVVDDDGSLASFDRFIRPAEGRITGLYGQTVVYGKTENIVVLQGIWIENSNETPIVASSTGIVVDTGNDVDNLGRFVVLSHENGYKTTYGHLGKTQVKVGDQIKKGEQLGVMGDSGAIGKTTLYFSIEQEGVALNPANFF